MIDLDDEMEMSALMVESFVLKAVEIDGDSIYIIFLVQIVVLGFNIQYLVSVIFFLICYQVDVVFEDKYLQILYHKF